MDRQGVIGQLNLAAAALLGAERTTLCGQRFGNCVEQGDRRAFADFLDRVWASTVPQVCEVHITGAGQIPRVVAVHATRNDDGLSCRTVAMDITSSESAEAPSKGLVA